MPDTGNAKDCHQPSMFMVLNWSSLINKEINGNIYRHSLWEYSKRFHCSFEWHLTPQSSDVIYRNLY